MSAAIEARNSDADVAQVYIRTRWRVSISDVCSRDEQSCRRIGCGQCVVVLDTVSVYTHQQLKTITMPWTPTWNCIIFNVGSRKRTQSSPNSIVFECSNKFIKSPYTSPYWIICEICPRMLMTLNLFQVLFVHRHLCPLVGCPSSDWKTASNPEPSALLGYPQASNPDTTRAQQIHSPLYSCYVRPRPVAEDCRKCSRRNELVITRVDDMIKWF